MKRVGVLSITLVECSKKGVAKVTIVSKPTLDEYTDGECEECGQEVDTAIEIGGDFLAWVCLECLRKAVKMLEEKD